MPVGQERLRQMTSLEACAPGDKYFQLVRPLVSSVRRELNRCSRASQRIDLTHTNSRETPSVPDKNLLAIKCCRHTRKCVVDRMMPSPALGHLAVMIVISISRQPQTVDGQGPNSVASLAKLSLTLCNSTQTAPAHHLNASPRSQRSTHSSLAGGHAPTYS